MNDATQDPERSGPVERKVELGILKALSHPLRIEIYDRLSQFGPATASSLASQLGESSGATSYHLRQLARHDLVREMPDRGTARERWWERTPGGVTLDVTELRDDPAAFAAATSLVEHWQTNREAQLREFLTRGPDELSDDWIRTTIVQTVNLELTHEQLAEFVGELQLVVDAFVDRSRGRHAPGSRPVQFQLNAFPLMDGAEKKP